MAASTGTDSKPSANQKWESRAVLRLIEAGSIAECPQCGERVKFRARHRDQQVICNVYEGGVWKRVEQFHEHCYDDAGKPHGEAIHKPMRRKSRSAKPADTTDSSATDDETTSAGEAEGKSGSGSVNDSKSGADDGNKSREK